MVSKHFFFELGHPHLFFSLVSNAFPDIGSVGRNTGRPESQQHTGSQIIRICMEIYLKIDKTVKMYKNSY